VEISNTFTVVAPNVDTRSTGRSFQAMARSAIDKIPPGPKLDALKAEKVFGCHKLHKHQGALVGRKQDKAGRWRSGVGINFIMPWAHFGHFAFASTIV